MKLDFSIRSGLLLCWGALCLGALTMTGCAWLTRPPGSDPRAQQLVEGLKQANGGLEQYKMLSQARFELEQVVQSVSSMAIAADWPNRMRVEVLSPTGQPLTSLVADGETIRIRPHGKERIYRFRQSDTALAHLIHIPLGVAQLQGILIGRPELPVYAGVQMVRQSDHGATVTLKSRWNQILAVLEFDTTISSIRQMEVFDEDGQSLYRVHWLQWRNSANYRVPSKLLVENDSGYQVTLRMRRFWPDVALSAATFELTAPD